MTDATPPAPPPTSQAPSPQAGDGKAKSTPGFAGFKPDAAPPPAAGQKTEPGSADGAGPRLVEFNGEKIEVPEHFWDAQAGQPNIGALLKSHGDLRKQLSEAPALPETYEPKLPEDIAKELEGKWELDPADPKLAELAAFAKEQKLDQAGYSKTLGLYAKVRLAEAEAADQAEGVAMEQEWSRMAADMGGDEGVTRVIHETNDWLKSVLTGKDGKVDPVYLPVASYLMNTEGGIRMLARFREMTGRSGMPASQPGTAGGLPTEADLSARSRDPRNIPGDAKFDPAFRAETDRMFKQVYDKKS